VTDFVYFLGRFHVLALHLPIGILLLAVVLEALSRRERFANLRPAVSLAWLAGAISALVTVALGYMHAAEPGFTGPDVNYHRWAGTALALAAVIIWVARLEVPRLYARVWPGGVLLVLLLMTATGHLGGNLTHGSTYLTEFAPGPLRSVGSSDSARPEDKPRPKVADIAQADIYLDVVAPALRERCASCHNEGKKRGGLSVSSYNLLMKGGESGSVIVAGKPEDSDLYRRITLPRDHVDYMPKNDKTPLTPAQVAAIRWWIEKQAPAEGKVGELKPDEETLIALKRAVGL
jgi:mono/diheme cytochrome c family protein/uncharacterized membrane protein